MKKVTVVGGEPVEYAIPPKKIKVEKSDSKFCQCNNCMNTTFVYKITLNESNFMTPKGNIGSKIYAKPYEIWLCEECFKQLFNAMIKELEK